MVGCSAMTTSAKTRAEEVFLALRHDILTGRLLPGSKLAFAEMTERYSCSMSVVREGLSRLVELGLVRSEPQHGFHVTPLSVRDLEDLTTARIHVEGLALGYSVEHGDIAWEASLVAANHALDRTAQMSVNDSLAFNEEWTIAHRTFHETLVSACPNGRLRSMAAAMRDSAELYRRWTRPLGNDDARDVGGEHRALLEAALAHDARAAVRILGEHLRRTADVLIAAADGVVSDVNASISHLDATLSSRRS